MPAPDGKTHLPAVLARADGSVQIAWQQGNEVRSMRWKVERTTALAVQAR